MEVWKPAQGKTAKILRNEHTLAIIFSVVFFQFLNVTTSFFVGSLSVSEIEEDEILQLGEQLATENDLSNRCMDDIG